MGATGVEDDWAEPPHCTRFDGDTADWGVAVRHTCLLLVLARSAEAHGPLGRAAASLVLLLLLLLKRATRLGAVVCSIFACLFR